MAARLTFRPAGQFHPGAVYAIMAECYADVLDAALQDSLRQFDLTIAAFPDTVGACSLISSVNDETVGFCSYDPRQDPEIGIVGHNGILPPFQRRGYGTQQILEIIRVLALRRFARVVVTTSEDPFFLPARRMYEKCGFRRSVRPLNGGPNPRGIVCYERPVAQDF